MNDLILAVGPGIKTQDLEDLAGSLIKERGVESSFLGYRGYPAILCVSVNEEVVHVVPGKRVLKSGDIVSLDLGVNYQGWHTDLAVTVPVGEITESAKCLLDTTREALKIGIKKVKAGATTGDIGYTIQNFVESQGYNVIKELCGHGIGQRVHEDPEIPNFGEPGKGYEFWEGQLICLEPMVTLGSGRIKKKGQGYLTKDKALSAHFEHTLLVQKNGAKILTEL